jgi:CoA:oxalate CoA-transferase
MSSPAAPSTDGSGLPLRGIRVLDLTTFLSGPFCTQILGDLGAEVIKLESFEGDSSRAIPPHFVGEDSAYYLATNRNKRSIAVNLKHPDGLALALQLARMSDVVVENFRPGVCERLGIDPQALRRAKPGLIWASISGFGQHSPWRDLPAYDMIVQALSGVMSITGEPGGAAVRLGVPAGDLIAGMYAVIGILAALTDRARTQRGRMIDIAMLDGQLSMLSYQGVYSLVAGMTPQPQAARHDSIATYRSFAAGDGREIVVTANTERMWTELCSVLGLPELPRDARFTDSGLRLKNRELLWPLLEVAFLSAPAADWVARLSARGVPAALIKTVPEALQDARAAGREMVMEVEHEDGRHAALLGNPIKFDGAVTPTGFPPLLAQDTDACLQSILGLTLDQIHALERSGALRRRADGAEPERKSSAS